MPSSGSGLCLGDVRLQCRTAFSLPGDDTRVLVVLEFSFPCIHFAHVPSFLLGSVCLEEAASVGCEQTSDGLRTAELGT